MEKETKYGWSNALKTIQGIQDQLWLIVEELDDCFECDLEYDPGKVEIAILENIRKEIRGIARDLDGVLNSSEVHYENSQEEAMRENRGRR